LKTTAKKETAIRRFPGKLRLPAIMKKEAVCFYPETVSFLYNYYMRNTLLDPHFRFTPSPCLMLTPAF
jgi:hypothetical protein